MDFPIVCTRVLEYCKLSTGTRLPEAEIDKDMGEGVQGRGRSPRPLLHPSKMILSCVGDNDITNNTCGKAQYRRSRIPALAYLSTRVLEYQGISYKHKEKPEIHALTSW